MHNNNDGQIHNTMVLFPLIFIPAFDVGTAVSPTLQKWSGLVSPEKKAWMRNFLIKVVWVRSYGDLLWFLIDITRLSPIR